MKHHSLERENYLNTYNLTIFAVFVIIPFVLIFIKFTAWGYSFAKILPRTSYEVTLHMDAEGFGDELGIGSFLPVSDTRQKIYNEVSNPGTLDFSVNMTEAGRTARWEKNFSNEPHAINYSFSFLGEAMEYQIDSLIRIPTSISPGLKKFLDPTENIQVNHPYINQLFRTNIPDTDNVLTILQSIYAYTEGLRSKPFKGLTDAVTAAKLNEASCNGKSRLFVALSRKAGIPAQLVGGIILNDGTKRTSHQWVEVFINGYWVPFDALNHHFATVPSNYLTLYRGDEFLFAHTPNINFNYEFNIKNRMVANPSLMSELHHTPLNAYRVWQAFEKIGIPLGLLKIIIMLPLGALFVAIFRNVIGIQTFGIFLPALIAVSSRETGLLFGLFGFLLIIGIVSLFHRPLEKLGLLYVPKMSILLLLVIVMFFLTSVLAMRIGVYELSYVTLFPIVILTVTAERFGRKVEEEGLKPALILTAQTLVVASIAYFAMNSVTMEGVFLAFPELFLVILGVNLWLGRWIGIRITEYRRFRWLTS